MRYSPIKLLFRNQLTREGAKAKKDTVNLEYYRDKQNLGDELAVIVTEHLLERRGLNLSTPSRHPYTHLMTVGSILGGRGLFDATVWGSGIRSFSETALMGLRKRIQKLDIRAVRGPLTRSILQQAGCYDCPEVYGDPAILLPLFYAPASQEKTGRIGLISHYLSPVEVPAKIQQQFTVIDIRTGDYCAFIDALCACDRIISASLHGIILAETYGIPALFLNVNRENELLKYYDWYFSTGRQMFPVATSVREAMELTPAKIPDFSAMRDGLLSSFPYDLWL